MLNLENLRNELVGELSGREAARTFEELRSSCPDLNPFGRPTDVVEFLHDPSEDCDCKDRVMVSLLRSYQEGISPSFISTMLALVMWPALLQVFSERVKKAYYHDDLWFDLQAAFFESLSVYPLDRRPQKVALNLKLETLRSLCLRFQEMNESRMAEQEFAEKAAAARELFPEEENPWAFVVADETESFKWDKESTEAAWKLLENLVDEGVVSGPEADLIFATRVKRVKLTDYAAKKNEGYEALRKRRDRAEKSALAFLRKIFFS